MVNVSCVVNCGTDNPKFAEFAKKMFNIADKSRDAELSFFDNVTKFNGNLNKSTFIEFLAALDELKLFAKVKKI